MANVTDSRLSVEVVLRAVTRGRRLDRAFEAATPRLSPRDRRFVQEVAYGVTRFRGRLDFLLDLHLRKGLSSLSPALRDLLRMGAYQLLYLDGVPPYAAISQTVHRVREIAGGVSGRVANGVLRSLDREGGAVDRFPSFEEDPEQHLSTWGSHPDWLVRRWLTRWSPPEVLRLVQANNIPAPLFMRPLGSSLNDAREALAEAGLESWPVGPGIPCLRLEAGTDPAKLLGVLSGIIQDPGAALVTVYADVPPGATVADLCAAPGGKSLAMAGGGAYVVAADRSWKRLRLVRENLERVGGSVDLVVALAQAPPFRELPYLLLDVPCSGTGTLRRHPDARWRMTEETMQRLVGVQAEILEGGSRAVAPGGVMVYSTCTLEPEENQGQIRAFLARNPRFALEESGSVPGDYLDEEGYLSVKPQDQGFDGAFAARMVHRP